MIYVDASAVPDGPSGVRTRLRGLCRAYGAIDGAPEVTLVLARGSRLLDGVDLGSVQLREADSPGGPLRRGLRQGTPLPLPSPPSLWHSETIPPLHPPSCPRLLTVHDARFVRDRAITGKTAAGHLARKLAAWTWLPRVLRRADRVVTVSSSSREELARAFGLAPEKVVVVPNAWWPDSEGAAGSGDAGLDLPEEGVSGGPTEYRGGELPPQFLIGVGPLTRRKAFDFLLPVLARLPAIHGARPCLVLAGTGPELERLRRLARSSGLASQVRVLTSVTDAELLGLFRRATALVAPSRLEGFGFPVFEALAAGCPVIASPLPCWDELPSPALTRCPWDADAWAKAILELATDARAARESAQGLREALKQRSWARSAGLLAQLYEECLAGS